MFYTYIDLGCLGVSVYKISLESKLPTDFVMLCHFSLKLPTSVVSVKASELDRFVNKDRKT